MSLRPAGTRTSQTSSLEANSERVTTPGASPVPLDVDVTTAVHITPQSDVIACRNLVGWVWRLQLHQDRLPQPCNIKQTRTIRKETAQCYEVIQRSHFNKQRTTACFLDSAPEKRTYASSRPDLTAESSKYFIASVKARKKRREKKLDV
jgi:hypothetical protein